MCVLLYKLISRCQRTTENCFNYCHYLGTLDLFTRNELNAQIPYCLNQITKNKLSIDMDKNNTFYKIQVQIKLNIVELNFIYR